MRDALIDHSTVEGKPVKAPKAACNALKSVLGYLTPLEKSNAKSESNGHDENGEDTPKKKGKSGVELAPVHCENYR
jgi:hypothetical protein